MLRNDGTNIKLGLNALQMVFHAWTGRKVKSESIVKSRNPITSSHIPLLLLHIVTFITNQKGVLIKGEYALFTWCMGLFTVSKNVIRISLVSLSNVMLCILWTKVATFPKPQCNVCYANIIWSLFIEDLERGHNAENHVYLWDHWIVLLHVLGNWLIDSMCNFLCLFSSSVVFVYTNIHFLPSAVKY